MALTPQERSDRNRIGAHVLHGRHDSRKLTEPARKAFLERFEREADHEGVLSEAERTRRAEHLRKAHMYRLALASSKARSKGGDAA